MQILIRFPDQKTEQRALGKLIHVLGQELGLGRNRSAGSGAGFPAEQGIKFTVIGPAPYEFITPVRDPGAVAGLMDGSPVPEALLAQTSRNLRARFGAASWENPKSCRGLENTRAPPFG